MSRAEPRPRLSAGAPLQVPNTFTGPQAAPLHQIGSTSQQSRNPREPFAVSAGALTEGTSAWGAAHSMRNADPAQEQWAPPVGAPVIATAPGGIGAGPGTPGDLLAPETASMSPGSVPSSRDPLRPIRVGNEALVQPGPFAAPGTPEWFAPGQEPQPRPEPAHPVRRIADLLTWPLVASLLLGLIPPISPVMLALSAVLAQRLDSQFKPIKIALAAAVGFVVFISLLASLSRDWWGTTSTWSFVATLFAITYTGFMGYLAVTGKRKGPTGRQ